jgi:hypothetical protein
MRAAGNLRLERASLCDCARLTSARAILTSARRWPLVALHDQRANQQSQDKAARFYERILPEASSLHASAGPPASGTLKQEGKMLCSGR